MAFLRDKENITLADPSDNMTEDFTPRDYQVELYQNALEEDTIIYLPTGSGKTFIALLLIKALEHEVAHSLTSGGKRTVFLVPTVVLAIQQASYIRRHTHLKVKEYYGSMNVDLWSSSRWETEFEDNQVLVMTAQIFVDILNHALQTIDKVNLLIFDECHAATKDAPMKQVLLKLDQCETFERPRILGLTAALFRKKIKPHQVIAEIKKLTESMKCVLKQPKDVKSVYQYSTKPYELIIEYQDDKSAQWHPKVNALVSDMDEKLQNTMNELQQLTPVSTASKRTNLIVALEEMKYLLQTFGPYAVYHSSIIYGIVMVKKKTCAQTPELNNYLNGISNCCQQIQNLYLECYNQFSEMDRLLKFVTPHVTRLLELLRRFGPDEITKSRKSHQLSSIIFVERRCEANILYHFLKDVSQADPSLSFLKPLFTMGQAAKNVTLKEADVLNMKQKEIIDKFRQGLCNLLVSTSVLEEGVDVPSCNLIIKFDLIKTYCDYVQSKGRARARKAYYVMLVNENNRAVYTDMLLQFHSIEQQLYNEASNFEKNDSIIDSICNQLIPPYSPFGPKGPQITMLSSIALVNRYCGKLTSGFGSMNALPPRWTLNTMCENSIDDTEWLADLKTALNKLEVDTKIEKLYQCELTLPLNSPMKGIVTGKAMPSKRLAKRAAALELCIRLHQLKELDDEHLLPIELEDLESEYLGEENDALSEMKSEPFYQRRFPAVLRNCLPRCGTTCFLYAIRFHPQDSEVMSTKLGILSSSIIPEVCQFPLFTRSGEYLVELLPVDCFSLDQTQIDDLVQFHRFLFEDVIFLFKQQLSLNVHDPHLQCLFVPMTTEGIGIDFIFAQKITNAPKVNWDCVPTEKFTFHAERYVDAVIVPWYQPMGKLLPYYVDAVTELTVRSAFPEQNQDFCAYYYKKYGLNISDTDQLLLKCSREVTGKNFLVPRTLSSDGKKLMYLVPELVYIHPLPASIWKQTVLIPSILHRLNGLLVANELRLTILQQSNIGVSILPFSDIGSWKPMKAKKMIASSAYTSPSRFFPFNLREQFKESLHQSDTSLDLDTLWNWDLFQESILDVSTSSDGDDSRTNSPVNYDARFYLSFDKPNPQSYSEYGPSPGQILEALTMARAGDGFSMERLETIGDSFLKLAASLSVYGQLETLHFGEGRLSKIRSSKICNNYLFKLGLKINLEQMLSAHQFDIAMNFLPPCFQVPASKTEPDCYLHHNGISVKNVADSVEALIGVYLLTTGTKGALTFLDWIGLKSLAERDEDRSMNPINGFPIIPFLSLLHPPANRENMIAHLFTGLELLEAKIRYAFKNKALLIEALTHASFYPNSVTSCFQRLEFLGDAVLDYLVTRYYYDDPLEYSPAILTDLRSATVNNEMFAVLAVRHGFHSHLKYMSVTLTALLDQFIRIQEQNGHKTKHNHFSLISIDECTYATNIEIPKVLGDIFESVAGAIFIDSGMSLDTVWQSYSPFLLEEIDKFNSNIPKSPVRILHEMYPGKIGFKSTKMEDERVCTSISIEGIQDVYKGVGRNTRFAKNAAAKYALYQLSLL